MAQSFWDNSGCGNGLFPAALGFLQQLLGRYDEDVEAGVRYAAVLRRLKLPGIRSYFTMRPLLGPMPTTCELAKV